MQRVVARRHHAAALGPPGGSRLRGSWCGLSWAMLARERFGCAGAAGWGRLRDWHGAGVPGALHRGLLERLAAADALEGSRVSTDRPRRWPQEGALVARGHDRPERFGPRAPGLRRRPLLVETQGPALG